MLEKILASTAYQSATIATNQAKAYLDAKAEARVSEQINYVDTGDGTTEAVKTTNTQMPLKSDYITGAAIELVSSLVKTIGKSVLSNINYTFKINKNAIVYADVVVTGDTSVNNSGGILKKRNLSNRNSTNEINEDGSYNFIPNDAGFEIDIESNDEDNSSIKKQK